MNWQFFLIVGLLIIGNSLFVTFSKEVAPKTGTLTYVGIIFIGLGLVGIIILWPIILLTKSFSLVAAREEIFNILIILIGLLLLYPSFGFLIKQAPAAQVYSFISIGTLALTFILSDICKKGTINWEKIVGLILGVISIFLLKK